MELLITQLFALASNTYLAFSKNKRGVYIANLLCNVFYLLTGLFQKRYDLVVSYIIIVYRSVILVYKDKLKSCVFPMSFIVAHLVLGVVTYKDFWSLIPMVVPIITGCVLWFSNNLQLYRANNIFNNVAWSIHNIYSGSYILIIGRVYTICANSISLIRSGKDGKKET